MDWMKLPPLNSLRAFATVAEAGGYTFAAERLNVTQAAVSRQVALIEDVLGMQLFVRGPRQLSLTEEGRFVFGRLTPHFSALTDD